MKTQIRHTEEITIRIPLEMPHKAILRRVLNFRQGQADRKAGEPCKSTNGAYLDGWYSPEQQVPPCITKNEMVAFNL